MKFPGDGFFKKPAEPKQPETAVSLYEKWGLEFSEASRASEKHPDRNEDSGFSLPRKGAFAVFDGVGGHAAGNVASTLARDHIQKGLSALPEGLSEEEVKNKLAELFHETNDAILAKSREKNKRMELSGMATTASVVQLFEGKEGSKKAIIANSGDSRVYVLRTNGTLEQITTDDSKINYQLRKKGKNSEQTQNIQSAFDNLTNLNDLSKLAPEDQELWLERNSITGALGTGLASDPIYTTELHNGDIIIITSDGVHDNLTSSQIAEAVKNSTGWKQEAENLVRAALSVSRKGDFRSKPDDISAIVVKIGNKS